MQIDSIKIKGCALVLQTFVIPGSIRRKIDWMFWNIIRTHLKDLFVRKIKVIMVARMSNPDESKRVNKNVADISPRMRKFKVP